MSNDTPPSPFGRHVALVLIRQRILVAALAGTVALSAGRCVQAEQAAQADQAAASTGDESTASTQDESTPDVKVPLAAAADAGIDGAAGDSWQVALARYHKGEDLTSPQHSSLAVRKPVDFLQYCWDRYRRHVRDYSCEFLKEERLNGRLRNEQIIDVNFRRNPDSVHMVFVGNVGKAKQALYIDGAWADDEGNAQALVQPSGSFIRLFVPNIKIGVTSKQALKESRRGIHQFGFDQSLAVIMGVCQTAAARDELDMRYVGRGRIDGRPTYVIERRLPYRSDSRKNRYPDRLLVIHIDEQLLLPTACFSYADDAGRELLGRYVYSDVRINVGLDDDAFDPDKLGF